MNNTEFEQLTNEYDYTIYVTDPESSLELIVLIDNDPDNNIIIVPQYQYINRQLITTYCEITGHLTDPARKVIEDIAIDRMNAIRRK